MNSVWTQFSEPLNFKALSKDINTDVLIIGGGIAGILCAYRLQQAGIDYTLVESGKICDKVTKNTTAKITAQHGFIYDKLISEFGVEKAKMYLEANLKAVEEYKNICGGIDCDFEEKSSYVYSLDSKKKVEKEIAALNRLHFDAEISYKLDIPLNIAGAVEFKNQAQFNPLKFLFAIAKNLNIYENTVVRELIGTQAVTNNGKITVKKIIVATHFPFINKHGSYFLKMYQHRSYSIALENAPKIKGMYVDEAQKGMSFRNYKDFLIIGGGDHRTGKTGGNWTELENFAKLHYPGATEKYRWATQDCMTLDSVPYIGNYSASTPDLYVATGFNKWGMTSAMVAADILTSLVLGKENEFASAFSPSRTILRPQLAVNFFEATTNLLTVSKKRCPHLGCALKWNPQERSWDCPCHGSRFDENGLLLNNPATGNLKISKEEKNE